MNPSAPDLSLYQSLQGIESDPLQVTVSSPTLQATVETLIDLLIERQIEAVVWWKLPNTPAWQTEIDRYLQRGQAKALYLCTLREESAVPPDVSSSVLIPVALETNSDLKRECGVIVLSAGFSCLLWAKALTDASEPESRWQFSYCFDLPLIARALERLKQSIVITDTTPEELIASSSIVDSPAVDRETIQWLLMHQIQQTERIQQQVIGEKPARDTIESLTESLTYSHELLKNLTQELKLPLTNMKTALRLLDSMQSKREQRQRYIDLLQRECDRQSLLLTGLQELIQFTQNAPAAIDSHLKLEDLIPGIVSTYQPLAEERGILLGYTIPPSLPAVTCPEAWLRQILLSLLSNSLKFTSKEGRVQVQANLKAEMVEITVSDTGIGIDTGELPQIFQSFYKGRNAIGNASSSAGLGLTLVQDLMTRCGGSIEVVSKVGKGTIFKLTFPVLPEEEKAILPV